ncbi:MAG: zf-HC2 domain-containing protein [Bryobacteraceae bacterium]
MRCPIETHEGAGLLLDFCTRKLDPDTAAVLDRHMESCAACREFVHGQQAVWEALDGWEAAPVSPDFNRRFFRRVESEERRGRWTGLRPILLRPALAVAAALVVLIAGTLLDQPPPRTETAIEVEQVVTTLEDMDMLRVFTL